MNTLAARAPTGRMTLPQFHNGLRILASIDHNEVPFLDAARWEQFSADPYRFFIRADFSTATAIWSVVEQRSTRS